MKAIFVFLIAILGMGLNTLTADPIEDLTKAEAERLVAYLNQNPYIIDYCNCCDEIRDKNEAPIKALFLQVTHAEIIPCSYNSEKFSVRVDATVLGEGVVANGQVTNPKAVNYPYQSAENLISMNYHFALKNEKANQMGKIIKYSEDYRNTCSAFKSFSVAKILKGKSK